jgi:hypothetical protein
MRRRDVKATASGVGAQALFVTDARFFIEARVFEFLKHGIEIDRSRVLFDTSGQLHVYV